MQLPLKLTQLEFCNRLKAAGFDAASLKAAGFDAASLIAAGFSYDELRNCGFAAEAKVRAPPQPCCVPCACADKRPSRVRFCFSSSSFLFCFSLDSLPLYHDPVPPLAAHDARALQARLVGKSDIHDAARSGSMGLVQDHILADGACVHKKDM